jgi:hypothetical protein
MDKVKDIIRQMYLRREHLNGLRVAVFEDIHMLMMKELATSNILSFKIEDYLKNQSI